MFELGSLQGSPEFNVIFNPSKGFFLSIFLNLNFKQIYL